MFFVDSYPLWGWLCKGKGNTPTTFRVQNLRLPTIVACLEVMGWMKYHKLVPGEVLFPLSPANLREGYQGTTFRPFAFWVFLATSTGKKSSQQVQLQGPRQSLVKIWYTPSSAKPRGWPKMRLVPLNWRPIMYRSLRMGG